MENNEIKNFIKVWLIILLSLSYCYIITKLISKGIKRLFLFLPIVSLFLFLPLNLYSINLCGGTAFFISWLANFKLLLLAFQKGPLALRNQSFGLFIAIACLPIEIKTTKETPKRQLINFPIKALLLAILIQFLDHYKQQIHPNLVLFLYCFLIYLLLEIILAITAGLARAVVGLEVEPQFNEPYLSTSLQDFWGCRWNLMVTRILRHTVYQPAIGLISTLMGRKWASIPAIIATFLVSGLVHELMYFYLSRVPPTWEVTCFFVLHGICLTVEIILKKALGDTWRFPKVMSRMLTIGFVMLTGFWLFFPQFLRCKADVKLVQEYANFGSFLRNLL